MSISRHCEKRSAEAIQFESAYAPSRLLAFPRIPLTLLAKGLAKANFRGYINSVTFDYDSAKDAANIAKHGLSLADFAEFDDAAIIVPDIRQNYGEDRFRAFGLIGGEPHSIAFTLRDGVMRLISFRRAHLKELKRHDPQA